MYVLPSSLSSAAGTDTAQIAGGRFLAHLRQQPLAIQTSSRLLSLPGELQNKIMEYVLFSPTPLRFVYGRQYKRSIFVALTWRQ